MNTLVEYIKQAPKIYHMVYGRIPIYFKNNLTRQINIDSVVKRIENILSSTMFRNISAIAIGDYSSLNDRDVDSVYNKKVIYLTNVQDNEEDIIENVVHEVAHSLEEIYGENIYGDALLKKEFLKKRRQLYSELAKKYVLDEKYFRKIIYTKYLDNILYKKIGYDVLSHFTDPIMISPYSATSLREYFSEGFEKYYMGEQQRVQELSPELYTKIKQLEEITGK